MKDYLALFIEYSIPVLNVGLSESEDDSIIFYYVLGVLWVNWTVQLPHQKYVVLAFVSSYSQIDRLFAELRLHLLGGFTLVANTLHGDVDPESNCEVT